MLKLNHFSGGSFAVFGLGKSGIATARSLMDSNSKVIAWDDDDEKRAMASGYNID